MKERAGKGTNPNFCRLGMLGRRFNYFCEATGTRITTIRRDGRMDKALASHAGDLWIKVA